MGRVRFPTLRYGQPRRCAASNLMAAWLLGALSAVPPFGSLAKGDALLALQSAMFMAGYATVEPAALAPTRR